MNFKPCLLLLPLLTLAACSDDDNSGSIDFKDAAVVAARAPDFSSGAVSLVDTSAPFTAQNNLNATISDISVRRGGDHYFLLRKFGSDQISRFDAGMPTTAIYTYSTNDPDEEGSNPYDLIVASETKGYLIRYGSGKLWIVNPSAATEAAFKTGEIDLSQYDADGVPEMSAGLIKNGKLYIAMQRLENFAAVKTGYVAVIDTATDTEITTGSGNEGLKGIELPVRDPLSLVSVPGSEAILVVADGGFDGNFGEQYEGGVVRINPTGYTATLLLDDGDSETHPYGTFADVAVVSGTRGYFIGSTGFFGSQSLYRFNPGTSAAPVAVTGFQEKDLGSLAVDPDGRLWVGRIDSEAPGLTVVGFANGAETVESALIDTVLTPINVDFVTVPTE